MSWWRDPVLRAMAVSLAAGLALLAFVLGLWIWVWPHG
jgi:hypothetical protein